jgi:lipoate-protein ligase A
MVCDALIGAYLDYYNENADIEFVSPDTVSDLPGLEDTFKLYSSWEWNYGNTPPFTHSMDERFIWGSVEVCLNVLKGHITAAKIYTDSLAPRPFEQLAEKLNNSGYNKKEINAHLDSLIASEQNNESQLSDFRSWFLERVE